MARTKPHTKVHVSVAHHPKTQEVWVDPFKRGMLVEVWRLGMERFAGKRGNILSLRPLDRLSITGESDLSAADLLLSCLFRALKYRVRKHPNRWDVHLRNYAAKHGFVNEESDTFWEKNPTHNKKREERTKNREERREKEPTPQAAHTPKEPVMVCPHMLPEPQLSQAQEWGTKRGTPLTELQFRWERVRRWSEQNPSKRRTASGWYRTLQNAVEDRWGGDPSKPPDESPAQGRQRRTREAAAGAMDLFRERERKKQLEAGNSR